MPLHPQAQSFVDLLAEQQPPTWEELGYEQAREVFLSMEPMFGPAPALARVADHSLPDGLRLRLYANQSADAAAAPVVLYFHGGGWVLGNLQTHDSLCRRLALHSDCTVIAVDYGLSPEKVFPQPIDDGYLALCYVAEHASELNIDASRIAVAGDSAGGHLAAWMCLKSRDLSGPSIALQVLIYPVISPKCDTPSYESFAAGFGLTRDSMRWFWRQFLGGHSDVMDAAPGHTGLHGDLPPAIVLTAEYDVLRDEGNTYARQLREQGVEVSHRQQDGMLHGFLHFAGMFDTGIEVGQQLGMEIGRRLRG